MKNGLVFFENCLPCKQKCFELAWQYWSNENIVLLILSLDLSNKLDLPFVTYADRNKWRLLVFFYWTNSAQKLKRDDGIQCNMWKLTLTRDDTGHNVTYLKRWSYTWLLFKLLTHIIYKINTLSRRYLHLLLTQLFLSDTIKPAWDYHTLIIYLEKLEIKNVTYNYASVIHTKRVSEKKNVCSDVC